MSSSSSTPVLQLPNFLYAAIAKGKTILVSHGNGTVNATQISSLLLDRIDLSQDSKQTLIHRKYQIHYIHTAVVPNVVGGLTYLVIGTESLGRRIPFNYLFDLRNQFEKTYTNTQIASAGANELQEFSSILAQRMDAVLDDEHSMDSSQPRSSDKAHTVQREIANVKEIMSQNIERVLERGERIDLLIDKSAHLGSSSLAFKKRSQVIKNQIWWQQTRTTFIIVLIVIFLIYMTIGIGCGLPLWARCF